MAILVGMHYASNPVAGVADHTYVRCESGNRGWGCWGYKSGGAELRKAPGSSRRADRIAEADEKAGIKCYLVNGVCHQAANRILLAAGITVRGARGYGVSQALFGTYGRIGVWPCKSPFNKHAHESGDLPDCKAAPAGPSGQATPMIAVENEFDANYIRRVLELYDEVSLLLARGRRSQTMGVAGVSNAELAAVMDFHVKLFELQADSSLGTTLRSGQKRAILAVRAKIEEERLEAELSYSREEITWRQFASTFNTITLEFQKRISVELRPEQYQALFDLEPGERVTLSDPEVMERISLEGS